ncbi:DUF2905 domain-containing protein [Emticicia sp. C21]|uniref:DUF2905 domain-containing protein n=1 Tax=Emticicia sp. C21 TaxID=2302915 RepID=UPI000E35031B|nr:DUF2905 domain-containing protein [Emticicia sp. C21]RFS15288.1 DUF2905 domain-containing protein [Emticicia sp. C21]
MNQNIGKYIIFIGGILILIGIVIYFFADKLHWFGRLPGDILYEKGNTRIYFPVVTMILLSLLLNLIIYLIKKFF